MIDQLVADLKSDEGWNAHPYRDSLGFLTIGYGFLIDPLKDVSLPRDVGEFWLRHAAEERWYALTARLPWLQLQPDEIQRALGNMAYQLGVDGVLGFKLMLAALLRGDRETAADNVIDSTYHHQTPARAERVAAKIRGHG